MRSLNSKFLLPALLCLGLCFSPLAVERAVAASEASDYYRIIGWEDKKFSAEFTRLRGDWLRSRSMFTLSSLRELAFRGDLDALALLAVTEQVNPLNKKKPSSFWTDAVLDLLGPAEGNYYLAMHYLLHLQAKMPDEQWNIAFARNAEHFLQSALAGHPEGALGAALTRSAREDYPGLEELKLPPGATAEDYEALETPTDWEAESHFWLVFSSVAGSATASGQVGDPYLIGPKRQYHDIPLGEHYFTRGARYGKPGCAAVLWKHYWEKGDYPESFVFAVLRARFLNNGLFVPDDEENYRVGHSAHLWGVYYINGDADFNIPPGSMTQADYDEGVRLSKIYYDEWKAKDDAKNAAREALYAKAREAMPALRKAWEGFKK